MHFLSCMSAAKRPLNSKKVRLTLNQGCVVNWSSLADQINPFSSLTKISLVSCGHTKFNSYRINPSSEVVKFRLIC